MNASLRRGGPSRHRPLDGHPPGSEVVINDPSSDDDQVWQRINGSIEAARHRRVIERAQSRDIPGIGR